LDDDLNNKNIAIMGHMRGLNWVASVVYDWLRIMQRKRKIKKLGKSTLNTTLSLTA
jgi:hypothetical protein